MYANSISRRTAEGAGANGVDAATPTYDARSIDRQLCSDEAEVLNVTNHLPRQTQRLQQCFESFGVVTASARATLLDEWTGPGALQQFVRQKIFRLLRELD